MENKITIIHETDDRIDIQYCGLDLQLSEKILEVYLAKTKLPLQEALSDAIEAALAYRVPCRDNFVDRCEIMRRSAAQKSVNVYMWTVLKDNYGIQVKRDDFWDKLAIEFTITRYDAECAEFNIEGNIVDLDGGLVDYYINTSRFDMDVVVMTTFVCVVQSAYEGATNKIIDFSIAYEAYGKKRCEQFINNDMVIELNTIYEKPYKDYKEKIVSNIVA